MEKLKILVFVFAGIAVLGWILFKVGAGVNAGIYLIPAMLASICVMLYLRMRNEK